MIIQLSPPIPIITPKGKALAHFMIDMGPEHNINWVCFQDSNGECWTWQNPDIRAQKNITQGRDYISPFYEPNDVSLKKEDEEDDKFDQDPGIDWKFLHDEKKELISSLFHKIGELDNMCINYKNKYNDLKSLITELLNRNKFDKLDTARVEYVLDQTGNE